MMFIKTVLYSILLFIFLNSCKEEKEPCASMENVPTQEELLPKEVFEITKFCIKNGTHWRFEGHYPKDVLIRVSNAYYSPDSTKLVYIIVSQKTGIENRAEPNLNYEINADPFIAYKNDTSWTVHHYGWNMPTGFCSYKYVEEGMTEWIEGKNYRTKAYVYFPRNQEVTQGPVGFNPNDEKYWSSQIWKKNLEFPDSYPFEIKRIGENTEDVLSINELNAGL